MVKKNGKEKDNQEKNHKEEDDKKEDHKEEDQEEVFKEKEKVNPQLLFTVRGNEHKTVGTCFSEGGAESVRAIDFEYHSSFNI